MDASHRLLLLVGLLTLWAQLTPISGKGIPVEKPGACPIPPKGTITPCIAKCTNDWSCDGPQKCCSWACMRACMDPV